jgi:predicted TIM-barrel fold metal-dependent hydrolase
MDYYADHGCRGIGELTANLPFDDPLMENLFRHAESRGLPVLFHIAPGNYGYYGIRDRLGLPLLDGALRRFPGLTFIGHSQPFWAEISGGLTEAECNSYPTGSVAEGGALVRLLRECPNLHADLSAGSGFNAVSRDAGFGYAFMHEFQDRLLFGTDVCDPRTETPLPGYLQAAVEGGLLSAEAFEKIAHRNAERLLKLDDIPA